MNCIYFGRQIEQTINDNFNFSDQNEIQKDIPFTVTLLKLGHCHSTGSPINAPYSGP